MKKILVIFLFLLCYKVNASIVIMDADSGRVLYNKNMNEKKLIASTTKIMTSIIALENGNLNDEYVVGEEIKEVNGSMIYAHIGDKLTLKDLLMGLMLQSGNDAAMIISKNVMNYESFIAAMNIKAYKLGMSNTTFENPHGLNDNTYNYSTSYDMALLMKYAIKNKEFINITRTLKYSVGDYIWYNKNKLLSDYKYLISGKIGYTKRSGEVYVSAAKKDNKTLIIVSIDENDKFNLHKKLYEEYFNKYDIYTILDKNTFNFKDRNSYDHYYIKNDFRILLKDNDIDKLKLVYNLNNDFNYIDILYDNKKIHSEKLYKLSYKETNNNVKEKLLFFK